MVVYKTELTRTGKVLPVYGERGKMLNIAPSFYNGEGARVGVNGAASSVKQTCECLNVL